MFPTATNLRRSLLPLVAVCLLSASLSAQPFRYGLQMDGKVIVDTSILDSEGSLLWDIEVLGSDRYVLKSDGVVFHNGETLYKLAKLFAWADLELDVVGEALTIYAIRQDGVVAANDNYPVIYPIEGTVGGDPKQPTVWPFLSMAVDQGTVWGLRLDGKLFQGASTTAAYEFGEVSDEQPFLWIDVAVDPITGRPYALRSDGVVFIGEDGDGFSTVILPPPPFFPPDSSALYHAIDVLSDGSFVALRGNGEVYTSASPLVPLVDFDGDDFFVGSVNELFLGFAVHHDEVWAIRYDGSVYRQSAPGTELFDYTKKGYQRLALSDEPPDISNIKNSKPVAASYKVTTYGGTTVRIPVVATDVDLAEDDLVVTVAKLDELPAGVTWTPGNRTLTFDQGLPLGSYKVTVLIDDGINKPAKAKYSVVVKAQDANPDKNKKPVPAKITKAEAHVGRPMALKLLAADPDGDTVTITPITTKGPFAIAGSNASWDPITATMSWTPQAEDIGKHTAEFSVSDGISSKTLKLKLLVKNSLVFDTDETPDPGPVQAGTRALRVDR